MSIRLPTIRKLFQEACQHLMLKKYVYYNLSAEVLIDFLNWNLIKLPSRKKKHALNLLPERKKPPNSTKWASGDYKSQR